MNFSVGAATDVGQVREANEDALLVESPLFGVADGMGGHLAGDVASSTAVDVISDASTASPGDPSTLAALIKRANAAIWEKAQRDPALKGMGTTCTLVLIDGSLAHVAHVGDSRAYLFRRGELEQITEDHTLVNRMVREGRLSREDAQRHPQRSIITRALGVDSHVEVDIESVELREGDRLLVCSDGLSSMVDERRIEEILDEEPDPQRAADRLIDVANRAGGEDNITVVVVSLDGAGRTGTSPGAEVRQDTDQIGTSDATPTGFRPGARLLHAAGRRWPRRLAAVAFGVALVAGGGYAAARWALDNSWFVGVGDSGFVTIYRGIPDKIAGLDLRQEDMRTDVAVHELPQWKRPEVAQGIRAQTRADAVETVANLQNLARDRDFRNRKTNGSSKDGK